MYSDANRNPDNIGPGGRRSQGSERRDRERRSMERRLAMVSVDEDRRSLERRGTTRRTAGFDRRLLDRRIMIDRNSLGS